ncbi:fumarate hydratase [Acidocella aminolytica]|jgi:fumarate hydratase class I|uniref:Fumarate hydratase class I n=1 Tax=Acidocella aminolytica 101 = DSM 11237 TaxID=1120923 RepID=A0A0D6PMI6_9PROT|nr:fumarate hydratase [Acidocella aminolytica]GAN82024.1 fumarate hydratase [Acidocella aminolytica 101 = DSM 11237]GBQ32120.1 fumarate hydratase [Acidocella aminolytica 101 = DSM 11237]SHE97158.1 fumarase, class I, homodimeric [Acidocella aminolytica 101 = DSM 11237]
MNAPLKRSPGFNFSPMFPLGEDDTKYRKLDIEGVSTIEVEGKTVLKITEGALSELAFQAYHDVSHLLRPAHLQQLANILKDPEASENDRYVAMEFLKNATIASKGILPMCQDTGTALIFGKKGQRVWVEGNEEEAFSWGVSRTYTETNLRYSQMAPLSMFEEKNTGNNLPVQFDIMASPGDYHADEFNLQFIAKGGGSANKTYLFQETRAVLTPEKIYAFIEAKIKTLGTSACPPYHLAIVIGGTSAELNLKTVKLASTKYYDNLPTSGDATGHAFRDLEMEQKVLEISRKIGIGAQFGGKYFCHDVRVIRLPRHGASLPIGIGVSCSADRQIKAKITPEGVFLEQLETNPAKYLPEITDEHLGGDVVAIDLNRPMKEILAELSKHPVKTRVALTGTIVVARDIAHAKLQERLDRGEGMPDYMKNHPVYYAGPAKTPDGMPTGSFGPTTAGRMDSYVNAFQEAGGSMVMLAKGNRSKAVTEACHKHGGFYLGSIGGPAAVLAQNNIKKVEVLEYPELGMEAVWKIEVKDFPAFIVVDDKGNDFFADLA